MKKFVTCIAVFSTIALVAWAYNVETCTVPVPGISVTFQYDTYSGGGPTLPKIDGFVSPGTGGSLSGSSNNYIYTFTSSYKVASNTEGKFFVLAHYHVEQSGVSTEFDVALPVYDKKPEATQWSRFAQHFTAYAYYDGSTIRYYDGPHISY